ncbi:DUF2785 domain-containing protein [Paenibacillus sp. MER 99-2]|uniref:DUF2785 domain-containing protein n=1 Tax=Paenibacillus sp. MER 99-2 TaxID=2939572 RepID=UPI0020405A5E|nr:DUF2785 domain-containing protein [Paenibacillus sp. MER 99-2]MCM3174723.1 DUF2785 domain-containing protein [Paenibacillus sp. MER 99-2]
MEAVALKEQLQLFRRNDTSPSDIENPYEVAWHMLRHIGSTDPVLRDELIYVTFATWIAHGVFSADQLREILHIAIDDEHLFYRLGEQGTDSVFTRTFSVLLLPPILSIDRQSPFLNKTDIDRVQERLVAYLKEEKDIRGYVEDKGWAHAPAHGADAAEDLAQSSDIDRSGLKELMAALAVKIMESSTVYIYDEDQRIAHAVVAILRRNLLELSEITSWIDSLQRSDSRGIQTLQETSQQAMNVRVFLQTLYFMIRTEEAEPFTFVRHEMIKVIEKARL